MTIKKPKGSARKPFNLLLSDSERASYEAAAAVSRRTLSDWIRVTLDDATKAQRGLKR